MELPAHSQTPTLRSCKGLEEEKEAEEEGEKEEEGEEEEEEEEEALPCASGCRLQHKAHAHPQGDPSSAWRPLWYTQCRGCCGPARSLEASAKPCCQRQGGCCHLPDQLEGFISNSVCPVPSAMPRGLQHSQQCGFAM